MNSINIKDLLFKINNNSNINIIDIRSSKKYNKDHIIGSININSDLLLNDPYKYLDKNKVYYIYCDFGNRSKVITSKLNLMGFNTVNIIGGYNNYLLWK